MIDTNKYEGHTEGPWKALLNHPQVEGSCVVSGEDESNFGDELGPLWVGELTDDMPDTKLIADAPLLLEGFLRLQRELDTQYEYIEWLEEFAPKEGDYNTAWDAYELAKGIHWTQMEEEE